MPSPIDVAIAAARQSGELQRAHARQAIHVREASAHDLKLQTDVECEALIRAMINEAFPTHAMLGEEEGGRIDPVTPTWIIDPLDGTVNFAHHLPYFCTSIALQQAGKTLLGVIYHPLLDELFTAEAGAGAFCNGQRLRVSDATLESALVAVGFSKLPENIARGMGEVERLAQTVRKLRIMGAAALDLAYVAAGRFDGFAEYGLRTWDIAAGVLLVEEAGGRVDLASAGEQIWDVRADNGKLTW